MKAKVMAATLLVAVLMLIAATTAFAHGVVITYTANDQGQIEFDAAFDNGEPLANAQVTIYAPSDPATPYLTAEADENGHYVFAPDQAGRWSVQFRNAGHGDIVHLEIEEVMEPVEIQAEANDVGVEVAAPADEEAEPAESEATTAETSAVASEVEITNQVEAAAAQPVEDEPPAVAEEGAAEELETEVEAVAVTKNAPADQPDSNVMANTVSPAEGAVEAAKAPADHAAATNTSARPTSRQLVVSSGSSGSTGFTTPQILLMSASVVWGFIGTALYFSSQRKKDDHAHS